MSLYFSLLEQQNIKSNSPCLHLLQVVQEVLQVLADPQVPEYRLFQLGLEVLSHPFFFFFFIKQQHVVSHTLSVCLSNLYNVMFLPVHLSLQRVLVVLEGQDVRGDL